MGLYPLTKAEYEERVPTWAKALDTREPRLPLTPGLRVFDVLYAGKYGRGPYGRVISASPDGEFVRIRYENGGECSAWSRYFVPAFVADDNSQDNKSIIEEHPDHVEVAVREGQPDQTGGELGVGTPRARARETGG